MLATRKLVAIGAVLAVTVSGIALSETMPDYHRTGPVQGQHPMGPGHMQEMMRRHQGKPRPPPMQVARRDRRARRSKTRAVHVGSLGAR